MHALVCALQGVLLLLAVPSAVAINSFAGPYIAYGRHYYVCGENCENTTWTWKLRTTHFSPMQPNELQRITGYMNIPAKSGPFGDQIISLARLDTRSNNQWKENAFVGNLPGACSQTRGHIPDVFRVFYGGHALKGKCEIPPGNYTFVNKPIRWAFVKFPIFPYGEYRFRLSFVKSMTSAPILCLCVDAKVIPKI